MAGKQVTGDAFSANLAGMSKHQLYDIMSQMKALIEQNQQQARQILIQNPPLTKALFQAQIMLGMVQPSQAIPNIQPPPSQQSQQSAQVTQQLNLQATQALSGQVIMKDQTGASQIRTPARLQHQNQPAMATSTPIPGVNIPSQPMPLHPLQAPQQPKGHLNPHVTPTSLPQSSQLPNLPILPLHSSAQPPPLHQPQMPTAPSQLQQSLPTTGIPHMTLQPPLPPQLRPTSIGTFQHQYPPQMATNVGYQHSGAPQHHSQPHHSQPSYHPGTRPPNIGPSFPHAQLPLPNQPPPQSVYQAGKEFNNQVGSSMQMDRGSAWMSAPPENPTLAQLSAAPPPLVPGNQPARPPSLTPEMEKALLQQVMSLTPDQINLLPPEQRNQVLQLQQILRQ